MAVLQSLQGRPGLSNHGDAPGRQAPRREREGHAAPEGCGSKRFQILGISCRALLLIQAHAFGMCFISAERISSSLESCSRCHAKCNSIREKQSHLRSSFKVSVLQAWHGMSFGYQKQLPALQQLDLNISGRRSSTNTPSSCGLALSCTA